MDSSVLSTYRSFLAVCLLSTFLLGNALEVKLTYKWSAMLTAGSLLPLEHLSKYHLTADVHVNIIDNKYFFQLENVSSSGVYTNLEALNLPFALEFKDDDIQFHKSGPNHSKGDELWSINIKKSLAGLFQIKKNAAEEGAFIVKENNTYGTCEVEYIAVKSPNSAKAIKLTKLMNELSCRNLHEKRRSNTPYFTCPSDFQDGIANHNERTYTLYPTIHPFIEQVQSVGTLHFQPFQALAEAHYIHVNQTVKLLNIQNNTASPVFSPPVLVSEDIKFTIETDQGPTSGSIPPNQTLLVEQIYKLLENLTDSLDWELSTTNLDNQTSFHVLVLMWQLNVQDWEKLYEYISVGTSYTQETIQHFFWELLPQVGSEASVIFIKNLITSKKVQGISASHMLIIFPLHLKQVSEKFLVESEGFLNLRDVDAEVKNSGILCFATMIYKVCSEQCAVELLDRYTKYFLDKFIESVNYQDRMVYLQALSNLQITRILDFLSPIIVNPSYGRHIRHMAIWCVMPAVEKSRQKASEIFWPIFVNVSEPLEIRVSAMSVLMTTQPSASHLLTFFWHMQKEPNYHLYNYFYTTVHSYANTKYPCYNKIGKIASQLSRYLLPRAYRWATGNYILDYEDSVRGYGGIIHFIIIASENTGLPSNFHVTTEHHSHGLSSKFSMFVKLEGVVDTVLKTFDINNFANLHQAINITRFLQNNSYSVKYPEPVHVEIILKIDGNALYCKYFNQTSLLDLLLAIKKASALYYEFSVNYQRLRFPLRYEVNKLTDLGTPAILQIRTASTLSLRGRIQQAESGKNRNAELDFRYSLDTVTSLKTFNPFDNEWYGTDRSRSLYARIPVSTHLFERVPRSVFEITANRHKDFADGSLLGLVWHSTIKLSPSNGTTDKISKTNYFDTPYFSFESRDLGARFDAKKFDCQGENDILDTLYIIKEAFQLSNKNYKMVIGGVPILGLYSLANYFTFLPPGDSCGIILSMAPLKVQLALLSEGNMLRLTMRTEKEQDTIWDLIAHYREKENDGFTNIDFRLEHSGSEKNLTLINGSWRLIQFEGYFNFPSFRQGILNAPSPAEGHAKLAWGNAHQSTSIELDLQSENTAKNWPLNCEDDTASCLQVVSNLATQQTVILNCINLPIWVTTALLSIFPDNVQADKQATKIQFSIPAKIPWTTQGICVINSRKVLNFDNATVFEYKQKSNCYSIAVAECSSNSQFAVGVKLLNDSDILEMRIVSTFAVLTLSGIRSNGSQSLSLNDTSIPVHNNYQQYPISSSDSNFLFKYKYWEKARMIEIVIGQSGLLIQYYGQSIVAVASSNLRGIGCGLCGDFNGEISNDKVTFSPCVADFKIY